MILFEGKMFNQSECDYIKGLGGDYVQSYFKAGNTGEIAYNLKRRNSFLTNAVILKDDPIFQKINKLFNSFGFEFAVDKLPFEIYKYNNGNFIVKHSDEDKVERNRFGAFICQLSDENDYEGGTFFYYTSNDEQKAISKEIGSSLVITTEVPHEVELITGGERKSMIITILNDYLKPYNKKSII
jgi:predicted 2-oxoglutarate/Fe(II)-dependent dioxygenase YbiX